MELTEEQRKIIEETITNKPGIYSIAAVAGSGKSFTIFKAIDYIKEHEPHAKILYLVFNKANQVEAKSKLMKYSCWAEPVECTTAHSYARTKYKSICPGLEVIPKLDKDLIYANQKDHRIRDVKYSKHGPWHWLHDKYISSKSILKTFCEDMYRHFDDDYDGPDKATDCIIFDKNNRKQTKYGIQVDNYSVVSKAHIGSFKAVMEQHEKKRLYTHGLYLKAAAYNKNTGGSEYDYVFFDEAQDASYFMLKLLAKQDVKKTYFVGDERQSIYKFGGSNENVFETHKFNKEYSLSRSFRFGDAIAQLANCVLNMHSNVDIVGTPQEGEVDKSRCTRLYRTNAKLFSDALELAYKAKLKNCPVRITFMKNENNEEDTTYLELLAFLKLFYKYEKQSEYYDNQDFFNSVKMTDKLKAFEASLIKTPRFYNVYNEFYDSLSDDIHQIHNYARNCRDFVQKYRALLECKVTVSPVCTITMVTMHRSKGLEWDNVVIAEPTKLYYEDRNGTIRRNVNFMQELNLAYVAITRARKSLDARILQNELAKEDLRFNNMSFVIKQGIPIQEEI